MTRLKTENTKNKYHEKDTSLQTPQIFKGY